MTGKLVVGRRAIQAIVHDGMSDARQVHTDLMPESGPGFDSHESLRTIAPQGSNATEGGVRSISCGFGWITNRHHAPSALWMLTDRKVNGLCLVESALHQA